MTTTIRRGTALTLAVAFALSGCWWGGDDSESESTTTVPTGAVDPVVTVADLSDTAAAQQLGLRLSEGSPAGTATATTQVVAGTPLTAVEVAAVLERLPDWVVPSTDRQVFERPPETLLPPEVGGTVDGVFPPPGDDPVPPATGGTLEVLRYQPEGPVDVAAFLSVTFDQPMISLATLDELDEADIPVQVTPALDGRWRWIGTRTLRFEVVPGELDRLPGSTEYTVEIPAGTRSATGGRLDRTVTWNFSTPTVDVTDLVGDDETRPLDAVFVAVFDQRVDAADVLATTTLTARGDDYPVRLATIAEIDEDVDARRAVERALPDRAVAFRAVEELPPDTELTITIGPGTPSAEGPRTTETAASFTARTFGRLEIDRTSCDWGDGCTPGVPFSIRFSNPLDPESFSADQVTIEPTIPRLRISVSGSSVEISGSTVGRTSYDVTFDASLRDVFGQTLGRDRTVTFAVASAPPSLRGLDREWITTDPSAEFPSVTVDTINHDEVRVRAWAVSPAGLSEFRDYLDSTYSTDDAEPPEAWAAVLDETVEIDADRDEWVETPIDLTSAFDQAGSQLVVRVESTLDLSRSDDDYWRNRPTVAWVQRTTLGVDAILDGRHLVIWTTDLTTGEPVGKVPVELIGDGRVATTDAEGLAEIDLGSNGVIGLWANGGDRTTLLVSDWWGGWTEQTRQDESRWYVFDDRGIYRPGETVRITGWARNFAASTDARLSFWDTATAVSYEVWDAQGVRLGEGTVDLNRLGGFNLSVALPDGANLGPAWVELALEGVGRYTGYSHRFEVQEFRRPEFEVDARNESTGPYFSADPATVAVDAEYYAGGPLPDAEVNWLVSTRESSYDPPNWDDFVFGEWTPWWYGGFDDLEYEAVDEYDDVEYDVCYDCGFSDDTTYEQFSGRTDDDGTHYLQIDFDGADVDLPTTVTAEATVIDVNRQAWASDTSLLVHAARYYVGLRSDRPFVERGTPLRIDAVATDVDGTITAGRPVDVVVGRVEWVQAGGRWIEQLEDEQTCTFTSTDDADDRSMRCEFATDVGGQYRITATITDDDGHTNRTEMTQWVSGGQNRPTRGVDQDEVTIVPDAQTYAPGDTAELLVEAPFAPAHGIVTIARGDIVSTGPFTTEDGSAVIEIEILDEWTPNVSVQIDMVGSTTRTGDDGTPLPDLAERAAYATGRIELSIPPITRSLDVAVTPAQSSVEPGTDTTVEIAVTDADGDPVVGADVALVVVDEAVLSLTGYDLADPLAVFYRPVWSNLFAQYLRSSIVLARSDLVGGDGRLAADGVDEEAAEEPAAADDSDAGGSGGDVAIDLRTNFDALAVYAPAEMTGLDGTVTVDVPLPDNLTRYRVMAVAVDGVDRFGKGESAITARLPLMVRPSAPRFLNFGDRFELPVVLQNQTDEPIDVDIAVQTSNLVLAGPAGRRVTVPANDRVEVRFPATTDEAGTARYRVAAVSGSFADATSGSMPVYTPATAEAFATYGVVDDDSDDGFGAIGQPISAPTGVFTEFGGLEVGTSSTAVQALTDAVIYLVDYRYRSTDALASRIMAIAALRDILEAFDAEGLPDRSQLDVRVSTDIERLVALQNDDGGWPWFQRGRDSIPFQSIQAVHALVLAEQAGYVVGADTLAAGLDHIASIEEHFPVAYSRDLRNTLSAYALYVRGEAGRPDNGKASTLYRSAGDDLGLDAIAWLWPSITHPDDRAAIETRILNAVVETAGAAVFATDFAEDAYVIAQSERRTDGIVLDALVTEMPDSDLIPKVVAGLIGNQTKGRWNNVYDNSFILLALHRYFATFEDVTPDFVARVWLGELYAAESTFEGRTTEQVTTLVPMSDVVAAGDTTIVIAKEGAGRLYYRLGLRYAPDDLQLDARDEGFVVERVYEGIDDPDDVRREADGTWYVRAGAKVRVTVTMIADAPRTGVALVDPLPAGLEAINPALAVSSTTPSDGGASGWSWWWSWYEHQNLRDDRVEAFASYLPGGTYEYSYVARATTPGEFVVPPTRAEEMYAPEVFGRSSSDRVVVEG